MTGAGSLDGDPGGGHVLRLFVTGTTPRSTRAVETLRRLLEEHLPGRYALEVVDIYQRPELAREHGIVAVPTLVRLLPEPVRRVIGDLTMEDRVLGLLAVEGGAPGGLPDGWVADAP